MNNHAVLRLLKAVMIFGLVLIGIGVLLHLYPPLTSELGVYGILLSAGCVAFGMILSLPTKMFITFILVKRETQQTDKSASSNHKGT